MATPETLNKLFGNMDLFLLDQLLKGRIPNTGPMLDAGCGEGRNIKYFISSGYSVFGIDNNADAIRMAEMAYRESAFFKLSSIEEKPFPQGSFQTVLCINVLHHCKNASHFEDVFNSLLFMLKPKGLLFIRTLLHEGPDHFTDEKFLYYSQSRLKQLVASCGLQWQEPLKKEVFDDGRPLGVIVLAKN